MALGGGSSAFSRRRLDASSDRVFSLCTAFDISKIPLDTSLLLNNARCGKSPNISVLRKLTTYRDPRQHRLRKLTFEYFISMLAARTGHSVSTVGGFSIKVSDVGLASYLVHCSGALSFSFINKLDGRGNLKSQSVLHLNALGWWLREARTSTLSAR